MQNLSCYHEFYLYENKNQFHIILSLALKQTLGGNPKMAYILWDEGKSSSALFIYISF